MHTSADPLCRGPCPGCSYKGGVSFEYNSLSPFLICKCSILACDFLCDHLSLSTSPKNKTYFLQHTAWTSITSVGKRKMTRLRKKTRIIVGFATKIHRTVKKNDLGSFHRDLCWYTVASSLEKIATIIPNYLPTSMCSSVLFSYCICSIYIPDCQLQCLLRETKL